MSKTLEKSLKDARKEKRLLIGSRQVLNSAGDSKLIVLSRSADPRAAEGIRLGSQEAGVPLLNFDGTSVALGRLCGLQFRTSAISFTSITEDSVKSIMRDMESGVQNR